MSGYNERKAVKYLIENADKMFIGIGIPYNGALISLNEVYQIGERIAGWSLDVQVCAIEYAEVIHNTCE